MNHRNRLAAPFAAALLVWMTPVAQAATWQGASFASLAGGGLQVTAGQYDSVTQAWSGTTVFEAVLSNSNKTFSWGNYSVTADTTNYWLPSNNNVTAGGLRITGSTTLSLDSNVATAGTTLTDWAAVTAYSTSNPTQRFLYSQSGSSTTAPGGNWSAFGTALTSSAATSGISDVKLPTNEVAHFRNFGNGNGNGTTDYLGAIFTTNTHLDLGSVGVVPEPETYMMFTGGLSALALMSRRRRGRTGRF